MAYFARRIRYMGGQDEAGASFTALIELARRKGGVAVGYVLYRYSIQFFYPAENWIEMIPFSSKRTAIGAFNNSFFSLKWQKTTGWLYPVAVGGGYEQVPEGTWVKVGRPAPRSKRRKKRPLKFGDLGCILAARQAMQPAFEEKILKLERPLSQLESWDDENDSYFIPEEHERAYAKLQEELSRLRAEMGRVEASIEGLKAEMRHKVRKMFPNPQGKVPKRLLRKAPELRVVHA